MDPTCNPLIGLVYLSPANIFLHGTWTDTSASDAPFTVDNVYFTNNLYLGTELPKTNYNMSIEAFDNNTLLIKLKGKQLDFTAFPIITEKGNSIFQRSAFHILDSNTAFHCIESFNKASLMELNADPAHYTFTGISDTTCNGSTWSKWSRR